MVHSTQFDPELGWVNVPNFYSKNFYGPGLYLQTNSRGFRNREEFAPPSFRLRGAISKALRHSILKMSIYSELSGFATELSTEFVSYLAMGFGQSWSGSRLFLQLLGELL
jgi:hypothetical protein